MTLRIALILLMLLTLPGFALAGTIKGTASYSGKKAASSAHKTGKYKKACGPEVLNESLLVNNQKLQNVVITLEGKKLKSKPGTFHMDQKGCRYEPHVVAMPKGSELVIHSSDPINHNIHTYSFDNDPINIMFTPDAEDFTQEMEEPEIIKVECDLHSWMTAWIVVTDNSFFSISNQQGSFEISDVPPGKYTVTAWHEVLGSITNEVVVGEKTTETNFDFTKVTPEVSQK